MIINILSNYYQPLCLDNYCTNAINIPQSSWYNKYFEKQLYGILSSIIVPMQLIFHNHLDTTNILKNNYTVFYRRGNVWTIIIQKQLIFAIIIPTSMQTLYLDDHCTKTTNISQNAWTIIVPIRYFARIIILRQTIFRATIMYGQILPRQPIFHTIKATTMFELSRQLLYQELIFHNNYHPKTTNISSGHYFGFHQGSHYIRTIVKATIMFGQSLYQDNFATIIITRQSLFRTTIILDHYVWTIVKATIMYGQSAYQDNRYFATIIIPRQPIFRTTIILDSIKETIMSLTNNCQGNQYFTPSKQPICLCLNYQGNHCTKTTDIPQQLSSRDN